MAGYRDTLNLPRTEFPMKGDLPRREPERMAWWQERDLYRKLRSARAGSPVCLLHDGPPYSNAHIHMGTASNKVWKDAVVRSASLLGFDSPYVPGWDNHGMPIETQVGIEFRKQGSKPDRLALRKRCRAFAAEWVEIQKQEFERLGVWGEWSHPYLTMDAAFEAEILVTFAALAARGQIQRGLRSIHWCPTDRTALAEAEIEYQDDPSPSIFVAFPLRRDPGSVLGRSQGNGPFAALAWTTTPWTLPANRGLMVDPGADYVEVTVQNPPGLDGPRRYLVAAARLAALRDVIPGWSGLEAGARWKGRELLGLVCEGPWGNDAPIVDGTPHVSMEDGTGLVHTAPGHGKEDFTVGQRAGFEVLCPVDEAGKFTAGAEPFVGRSVIDADLNREIVERLRAEGRLLAEGSLTHAYPHCWRCHGPVIFRATKQWFVMIDHDRHRERALHAIEEDVRWEPPSSQNRIRDAVRLRPDWCISRQRSWGVGIPAVYCGSCEEAFLDPHVLERAASLTRELGSDAWYELPVERFVPEGLACPHCGARGPFRKETDILDVWFDSGSTHRAIQVTHPALRETWQRARAEGGRVLYFEGPDQHRGWFNSSLMIGIGTADQAPFTDVLTHGWVLDAEGRAMHKSLGNVIAPETIIKQYGADIVRWWALATDWRSDVRVGAETLQRVAEAYRKVRNTFRFLLGNLADFTPAAALPRERMTGVDRVFSGHLAARTERMREDYARFLFHRVVDGLLDVCTVDLSAVFLDVAKDRLYTLAPDDPARRSAQTVLWQALHDLTLAASPLLAFTAEEVWQHHPGLTGECESVHLARLPERTVEADAEEAWSFLLSVRDTVNRAIEPLRADKRIATTLEADVTLEAPAAWLERLAPYRPELTGFLLVASLTLKPGPAGAEPRASVTRTAFARCERCWTHRPDVATAGPHAGLCERCVAALAAAGGAAG